MDLPNRMWNKRSHTQKQTYCMISFIQSSKTKWIRVFSASWGYLWGEGVWCLGRGVSGEWPCLLPDLDVIECMFTFENIKQFIYDFFIFCMYILVKIQSKFIKRLKKKKE